MFCHCQLGGLLNLKWLNLNVNSLKNLRKYYKNILYKQTDIYLPEKVLHRNVITSKLQGNKQITHSILNQFSNEHTI